MEGKIYSAICGVMEDVGAVGKDDYNKTQGFKYRGIDAVMNALNPAMIKHKIFCAPEVLEQNREERRTAKGGSLLYSICRIRYRFFTTDGSYIDTIVVGEGMDSGDKATNKAMAVAFKYACFQLFCIPTENLMDDPDAQTPEASVKQSESRSSAKNEKINEEQVNELLRECDRTGMHWKNVCEMYKVEKFSDMNYMQYKNCISRFHATADKTVDNKSANNDTCGLNFS